MKQAYEEMTLESGTVARIALHVYKKWQESQKPPLFATTPFHEWLQNLIDKSEESA